MRKKEGHHHHSLIRIVLGLVGHAVRGLAFETGRAALRLARCLDILAAAVEPGRVRCDHFVLFVDFLKLLSKNKFFGIKIEHKKSNLWFVGLQGLAVN